MSYTVQWSFNYKRWFSYGEDWETPPAVFDVLDDAIEVFDRMVAKYYALHYCIVDSVGGIVLEGESEVDFPEGYWERPVDYAHTTEGANG